MIAANEYSVSWIEEQLTANLVRHMTKLEITNAYKMDITVEPRQYNEEIEKGKQDPKTAPRLDIRMCMWYEGAWSINEKFVYTIEAKNISENDWVKETGANVRAIDSQKRYISTGIDHFISGHYKNGCLAGYVVNGDASQVAIKINELLTGNNPSRQSEVLTQINDSPYPNCYLSEHANDLQLIHFMLKL